MAAKRAGRRRGDVNAHRLGRGESFAKLRCALACLKVHDKPLTRVDYQRKVALGHGEGPAALADQTPELLCCHGLATPDLTVREDMAASMAKASVSFPSGKIVADIA